MSDKAIEELVAAPSYPPPPTKEDPLYLRAAQWLSDPPDAPAIAMLLGAPFSALSISGARCDLLPPAVRESLWAFSTFAAGSDLDLAHYRVDDLGDVSVSGLSPDHALKAIGEAVGVAFSRKLPLVLIGGDNSVTAPAVLNSVGAEGGLITFDAHHDLRDHHRNGLTNGSPVRVLLDEGLPGERIWQIGIADWVNSSAYARHASQSGINVVGAKLVHERGMVPVLKEALASLSATDIYVDFDIDVVERALVPGAPAAAPGGIGTQDLIEAAWICGRDPRVQMIDLVEVDPQRDVASSTVRLVCMILLSFLSGVASRSTGAQ